MDHKITTSKTTSHRMTMTFEELVGLINKALEKDIPANAHISLDYDSPTFGCSNDETPCGIQIAWWEKE